MRFLIRVILCCVPLLAPLFAQSVVVLGPVRTADTARPVASGMVLRDGIITSMDRAVAEALAAQPGTVVLRVPEGGAVLPGIIESHAHLRALGRAQRELDLSAATSLEAATELVKTRAAQLPEGAPLRGRGWNQELWPEKHFPSAAALDAVAPGRLVLLTRVDGHALWVNSAVLRACGITAATRCPSGGEVVLGADGQPTGVLVDNAMALVGAVGTDKPEELNGDVRDAERTCRELGITTLVDAGASCAEADALSALDAAGQLQLRVETMLSVDGAESLEQVLQRKPWSSGRRHSVRMVKLYADGALGSRGAWLLQPYADRPDHSGFPVLDPVFLRTAIRRLMESGWQVCVHCIGDRAVRTTLDAMEVTLAAVPPAVARNARPRIEHAQHIDAQDLPRFAKLGVIASMQPCHAVSDGPWVSARLGAERTAAGAYVWRSLLRHGTHLAFGTDAPVEPASPWRNFAAAVTRRLPDGSAFHAEQCVSRAEALAGLSVWGAWAARREQDLGRLRPGLAADLIIVDRDPLRCPAEQIEGTRVLATLIAGEIVHSIRP